MYVCIWGIPAQIDLTVTIIIFDFFPRAMLKDVQKLRYTKF